MSDFQISVYKVLSGESITESEHLKISEELYEWGPNTVIENFLEDFLFTLEEIGIRHNVENHDKLEENLIKILLKRVPLKQE